jgi:hypothetical protein
MVVVVGNISDGRAMKKRLLDLLEHGFPHAADRADEVGIALLSQVIGGIHCLGYSLKELCSL